MNFKKKSVAVLAAVMTVLCIGTTAFAASYLENVETVTDSIVLLGLEAEKEADGIAKFSFDMGKTWVPQDEYVSSPDNSTEFWTYEEYKTFAEMVENDLLKMVAAGEPDLTYEDVDTWRMEANQKLAFIEAGGKLSKISDEADSQLMISGIDNSVIESISEKK